MAVILGFPKNYSDLRGSKGSHDGLWKQIYVAREGDDIVLLRTKAHRSRELAVPERALDNFIGNDVADSEAKKSAGRTSAGNLR